MLVAMLPPRPRVRGPVVGMGGMLSPTLVWAAVAAACASAGCSPLDAEVRSGETVLVVPASYLMMPPGQERSGALMLAQHPTFRPYPNHRDQDELIPDDGLLVLVTKTGGITTRQEIERGLAGEFSDAIDDATYDRAAGLITRCPKKGRVPNPNCSIQFDYNPDLFVVATFDDRLLGSKDAIRAGAMNLVAGFERAATAANR